MNALCCYSIDTVTLVDAPQRLLLLLLLLMLLLNNNGTVCNKAYR